MANTKKIEGLRTVFEESIKSDKYPQSMRNIIKAASAAKENEDKVDFCRSLDTGKKETTEVTLSTPDGERINVTATKEENRTVIYDLEITSNLKLCYAQTFYEA